MSEYKKNAQNHDVAIIGNNLSALLLVGYWNQRGAKVAHIGSNDHLAHFYPNQAENLDQKKQLFTSSSYLVPNTNENQDQLGSLKDLMPDWSVEEHSLQPITFEGGHFKDFIGFGARQFSSTEILSGYNSNHFVRANFSAEELLHYLRNHNSNSLIEKSEVTQIMVEGGQVVGLKLNDVKVLPVSQVYFCHHPIHLLELLTDDELGRKNKQKIAKTKRWSKVELHFTHGLIICENQNPHFLMGTKDDHEPCLGHFSQPIENIQKSSWTYFVSSELVELEEDIANIIRYMKKQIKRAYPNAFEDLVYEKIIVSPDSHGYMEISAKEFGALTKARGLYVAHPCMSSNVELIGHIEVVQRLCHSKLTPHSDLEMEKASVIHDVNE